MGYLSILFLAVGLQLTYINCIICPGDEGIFEDIGGTCYYLSFDHGQVQNWQEAQTFCKDLGRLVPKGKMVALAEIGASNSVQSDSLLMQKIARKQKWAWLGANDITGEDTWTWVTSSRTLSLLDPFWENSQPNKPGSPHTGLCLVAFIEGPYQRAYFGDWHCENQHAFICQIMDDDSAVEIILSQHDFPLSTGLLSSHLFQ